MPDVISVGASGSIMGLIGTALSRAFSHYPTGIYFYFKTKR